MEMNNNDSPVNLATVLEELENTLYGIIVGLQDKLNLSKPPESLYHYTNDTGLHGIMESGKLRLSDIFSLNDPSELKYGLSHAIDILNRETANGPTETKIFAEEFSRYCDEGIKNSGHYFVCSFSKNEHDLGQWRAYADNGRGYVLEFNTKLLADDFGKSENINNNTFPMTYEDDDIVDTQQKLIAAVAPLISLPYEKNCIGFSTQLYLENLSGMLSHYALHASLFFKHKAYDREAEFRFLQIFKSNPIAPDMKKRARSNELVKYREFDWKNIQPMVLKRIIIGPAADKEKARRFVNDCLNAYYPQKLGEDAICDSAIPYRAVPN